MESNCWLCSGSGFWVDTVSEQTMICHLCRPAEAGHQALIKNSFDRWYPSMWPRIDAKHYGPKFQQDPWLLVVHSGAVSDGVAEYFSNPRDGRKVSTHLAWSRKYNGFAQCVPLANVGWHVGGSIFRSNDRLNFCSIGIELPGPCDGSRDDRQRKLFAESISVLIGLVPSLKIAVRHSDIDPSRRDPGDGFDWGWFDGISGLRLPFVSS
jgi:N-acetyl-anhydromuramyl-L-alanine amidase AmpD